MFKNSSTISNAVSCEINRAGIDITLQSLCCLPRWAISPVQHSAQRKAGAQIDAVYRHFAVLVPLILAVGEADKAGDLVL